jgi:hypothetical protein
MTRWKTEFRLWAAHERLHVFTVPKDWREWDEAKLLSRMVNNMAAEPQFQAKLNETVKDVLFFGSAIFDPMRW